MSRKAARHHLLCRAGSDSVHRAVDECLCARVQPFQQICGQAMGAVSVCDGTCNFHHWSVNTRFHSFAASESLRCGSLAAASADRASTLSPLQPGFQPAHRRADSAASTNFASRVIRYSMGRFVLHTCVASGQLTRQLVRQYEAARSCRPSKHPS